MVKGRANNERKKLEKSSAIVEPSELVLANRNPVAAGPVDGVPVHDTLNQPGTTNCSEESFLLLHLETLVLYFAFFHFASQPHTHARG